MLNFFMGATSVVAKSGEQIIDEMAQFHIIADDIIHSSNTLVSWKERVSGTNLGVVGSSIVTIPNYMDGHRAVSLLRDSKCFTFPNMIWKSFYGAAKRFRSADNGPQYYWRANVSDVNTDISGVIEFSDTNNIIVTGSQNLLYGQFVYNAAEIAYTTSAGIGVIDSYRTPPTLKQDGVARTPFDSGANPTPSSVTLMGIFGDKSGFGAMKADILEIIAFSTEATVEQDAQVIAYLQSKYPSL